MPKAGPGREARLEKKKMMAQKRRDREISPGIYLASDVMYVCVCINENNFTEMAESTLMGPA